MDCLLELVYFQIWCPSANNAGMKLKHVAVGDWLVCSPVEWYIESHASCFV